MPNADLGPSVHFETLADALKRDTCNGALAPRTPPKCPPSDEHTGASFPSAHLSSARCATGLSFHLKSTWVPVRFDAMFSCLLPGKLRTKTMVRRDSRQSPASGASTTMTGLSCRRQMEYIAAEQAYSLCRSSYSRISLPWEVPKMIY
jgi:hypothetical protein